jgi:putative membrane protein
MTGENSGLKNIGSASEEEWRRTRRIVTYGVALLVLVGAAVVLAVYFRASNPGPWPFYPFGFGWIWTIFAFFFVFWVLRWVFWPLKPYPYRYWRDKEDAVSILRARYAGGEITKEQFEQMRRDLE